MRVYHCICCAHVATLMPHSYVFIKEKGLLIMARKKSSEELDKLFLNRDIGKVYALALEEAKKHKPKNRGLFGPSKKAQLASINYLIYIFDAVMRSEAFTTLSGTISDQNESVEYLKEDAKVVAHDRFVPHGKRLDLLTAVQNRLGVLTREKDRGSLPGLTFEACYKTMDVTVFKTLQKWEKESLTFDKKEKDFLKAERIREEDRKLEEVLAEEDSARDLRGSWEGFLVDKTKSLSRAADFVEQAKKASNDFSVYSSAKLSPLGLNKYYKKLIKFVNANTKININAPLYEGLKRNEESEADVGVDRMHIDALAELFLVAKYELDIEDAKLDLKEAIENNDPNKYELYVTYSNALIAYAGLKEQSRYDARSSLTDLIEIKADSVLLEQLDKSLSKGERYYEKEHLVELEKASLIIEEKMRVKGYPLLPDLKVFNDLQQPLPLKEGVEQYILKKIASLKEKITEAKLALDNAVAEVVGKPDKRGETQTSLLNDYLEAVKKFNDFAELTVDFDKMFEIQPLEKIKPEIEAYKAKAQSDIKEAKLKGSTSVGVVGSITLVTTEQACKKLTAALDKAKSKKNEFKYSQFPNGGLQNAYKDFKDNFGENFDFTGLNPINEGAKLEEALTSIVGEDLAKKTAAAVKEAALDAQKATHKHRL